MTNRFLAAWLEHGATVEAADLTHTSEKFDGLCDGAVEIIDHTTDFAEGSQFSEEQFGWKIEYDGSAVTFSHLISLHKWLVANELMIGNIQKKHWARFFLSFSS
ncbi:hypothetical protein B0H14DRAFT_2556975 [Mycena olivaceomarginata]|nr:hypothetical protein B0H14DRAFT_2556975 [Mycena olivaceomarginata]